MMSQSMQISNALGLRSPASTLARSPATAAATALGANVPPTQALPPAVNEMPAIGPMQGQLFLNPKIAPNVPQGSPRPFAPGEYIRNPNGGWSSEISLTITDPSLNNGAATVVPSLWIVNGQAVRVDEDTAAAYAVQSGLPFKSYSSIDEAEKASIAREQLWQGIDDQNPAAASSVPALWGQ